MLEDARHPAVDFKFLRLAVAVQAFDLDSLEPFHFTLNAGDREAAFHTPDLFFRSLGDLRVDPSEYSTTINCSEILTCGAASPTPGASRMVSIMSSIKVCKFLSNFVIGFALRRRTGSGTVTICLKAILFSFLSINFEIRG
jgi:hypothetical protein